MNPDELPADVRVGARAELEEAAQFDAGIRAALSRLKQAEELIQEQNAGDTRAAPSCSVNIGPDRKLHTNFDPYADKSVTVSVLKKKLAEVEAQLTARRPQTDKVLTRLDKDKRDLETAIESFSDAGTSTVVVVGATSRKDKRIEKKLLRKATKLDQMRK